MEARGRGGGAKMTQKHIQKTKREIKRERQRDR